MFFDIDQLAATKQTTYRIVVGHNPGKDDMPGEEVGFEIVGPNSDEYQRATREAAIQGVQEAEIRVADDAKPKLGARETAENAVQRREATNALVIDHCVVGWFGFRRGDAPAEFNKANLKAVLNSRPNWRFLILNKIENSGNFGEG